MPTILDRYSRYMGVKSAQTKRAYTRVLTDFGKFMDSVGASVESVNQDVLQDYINALVEKNSPVTVKHRLTIIKTALESLGTDTKRMRLALPRPVQQEPEALDEKRLARYYQEVNKIKRSERLRVLLMILPMTGMRISEAVGSEDGELPGLTRSDILRRDNIWMLRIHGKGNKVRDVPLNDRARGEIMGYARGLPEGSRLFQMHPTAARKALQVIGKRIGAPWLSPHSLRHTFVTSLIAQGVDLKTVQELAGHSSAMTTMRYVHTTTKRKLEAVNKI